MGSKAKRELLQEPRVPTTPTPLHPLLAAKLCQDLIPLVLGYVGTGIEGLVMDGLWVMRPVEFDLVASGPEWIAYGTHHHVMLVSRRTLEIRNLFISGFTKSSGLALDDERLFHTTCESGSPLYQRNLEDQVQQHLKCMPSMRLFCQLAVLPGDGGEVLLYPESAPCMDVFDGADLHWKHRLPCRAKGHFRFCVDPIKREIYFSDRERHQITVVSASSGPILRQWGKPGQGPGELNGPTDICVIGDEVFVLDHGNNRIQVFLKHTGEFLRVIGSGAEEDVGLCFAKLSKYFRLQKMCTDGVSLIVACSGGCDSRNAAKIIFILH